MHHVRWALGWAVRIAAVVVLASCGGGGGTDTSPSGNESPSPPPPMVGKTVLAPSVPAAAASAVTSMVSTAGTVSQGPVLPMPELGSAGEALVYALNTNGEVLLVGISGTNGAIDADSMALLLVRLSLGALRPTDFTVDQVVNAIRGTPAYVGLVSAINQALTTATPPMNDAAVGDALRQTTLQAREALEPASVQAAREKPLAVTQTEAKLPLPYYILDGSLYGSKLWVDHLNGGVKLVNATRIEWAARSNRRDGSLSESGVVLQGIDSKLFGAGWMAAPGPQTLTSPCPTG